MDLNDRHEPTAHSRIAQSSSPVSLSQAEKKSRGPAFTTSVEWSRISLVPAAVPSDCQSSPW
jgi:hypothetical protein